MIKGGDYFQWDAIGALLANKSDIEQTAFFKAFLKEIDTWDSYFHKSMQMTYIGNKLTDREKELLGHITYQEAAHDPTQ